MAMLYPKQVLPSSGIPIVQGVVVGERAVDIDAVPLLDVRSRMKLVISFLAHAHN